MLRTATPRTPISIATANAAGQQLFLADLFRSRRFRTQPAVQPAVPPADDQAHGWARGLAPVTHRQLVLLPAPRRSLENLPHSPAAPADSSGSSDVGAVLDRVVIEHATEHGWSQTHRDRVRRGIRLLLTWQETPGAPIKTSDLADLHRLDITIRPVREVLADAGMLEDDRADPLDVWFARRTGQLPEPMATELGLWFTIQRDGNHTPPRSKPRAGSTIRVRVNALTPVLHGWAAAGHHTLRQITPDHIRAALTAVTTTVPATGTAQDAAPPAVPAAGTAVLLGSALRSVFKTLKAHKVVFTDPTSRIRLGRASTAPPALADLDWLHDAVTSGQPARAAMAALLAFHAPRPGQLRELKLTDIRDRRLHLPGRLTPGQDQQDQRSIPLAPLVQELLSAWLDHRQRRWPHTLNPYLFINIQTAVRAVPVSYQWVNATLGMSAQAVRADRILFEAATSDGDIRRVADLFGLSVSGAQRYTDAAAPTFSSRTPAPG